MPVHERRQHFRIDDHIHFAYKIIPSGECCPEDLKPDDFFDKTEQRHIELLHYIANLDREMAELTRTISMKEPSIAHYLNLLNAKIDYIVRNVTMNDKTPIRKVNLSLGGISFQTDQHVPQNTRIKLLIYTKPGMIPIILNSVSIYCKRQGPASYRTATKFEGLTQEEEQLLSQHIMLIQVPCRAD